MTQPNSSEVKIEVIIENRGTSREKGSIAQTISYKTEYILSALEGQQYAVVLKVSPQDLDNFTQGHHMVQGHPERNSSWKYRNLSFTQ